MAHTTESLPTAQSARRKVESLIHQAMQVSPQSSAYVDTLTRIGEELLALDRAFAERVLREACTVATAQRNAPELSRALALHAWCLFQMGRADAALLQAEHAQALRNDDPTSKPAISARYVIAMVRGKVGDLPGAQLIWRELLSVAHWTENADLAIRCHMAHGIQLLKAGQHAEAQDQLMTAYQLCVTSKHEDLASSANNIARTYAAQGDFAQAIRWAEQALHKCPDGEYLWRVSFLHTLGNAHLGVGDVAQAEQHLSQSLTLLKNEHDDIRLYIQLRRDLGKLAMTKGAIPDALSALHDALERAIQARAIDLESALHAELQSCYHSIGAFETSLNHCARRVAALQRQIGESAASTQDITQALRRVPDLRTRWANDPFAQA